MDTKFKVGQPVMWRDTETNRAYHAVIVKHGRDANGCYTEIEPDWEGEETVKVHRSSLRACQEAGVKVGMQHP